MYPKLSSGAVLILVLHTFSAQESMLDGIVTLLQDGDTQYSREPQDIPNNKMKKEYDFVVVGAGTAGCVLANRLSENPEWSVLVIEAGSPENILMDIPMLAGFLQFTQGTWSYKTEPSGTFCKGMVNERCQWTSGKVVGGTSVIDHMVYARGNRRDYDNWADLGNTGWSFDNVLPYFKKVENFNVSEYQDSRYHSNDGHVTVSYAPFEDKIAKAVLEASQQYGLKLTDYNGPVQIGASRLQLSMRDGVRESASRAYLHPISDRPNLHMKKYSMVTKILIDPTTKRAYGVEYVRSGQTYTIFAKKEVILSAGAIKSPQLLMLSGIGPKKHLTSIGIPVISNLKVGYNLMDHVSIGGLTFVIDKPYSMQTHRMMTKENMKLYLNHHQGPWSSALGTDAVIYHDFSDSENPDGHPKVAVFFSSASILTFPIMRYMFGIRDEIYNYVYKPFNGAESFTATVMHTRPKSRGRIKLKNINYKFAPLIYPNYFDDQSDMETILKGLRFVLNITSQPAIQDLGTRLHSIPIPQCADKTFASDDYFECMIRYITFSMYHYCGTCKMGPLTDKMAIVDPKLRVYGVKNLRVIDASIMPEIPSGHISSPTYMISEKGADIIKQDWGYLM